MGTIPETMFRYPISESEVKYGVPTFREEAERVIELKSSSWKDAKVMGRKWRSTFEKVRFSLNRQYTGGPDNKAGH